MTTNQAVTKVRGSRKKITMEGSLPDIRLLEGNEIKTDTISVKDFLSKQKEFILTKKLEGLAERTLKDYEKHFHT